MKPFNYPAPTVTLHAGSPYEISLGKRGGGIVLSYGSVESLSTLALLQHVKHYKLIKALNPESKQQLVVTGSSPGLLLFCQLEKGLTPFEQLTSARKALAQVTDYQLEILAIYSTDLGQDTEAWLDAFARAHLAARFALPSYKSELKRMSPPAQLILAAPAAPKINVDRLQAEAEGNALSRHLAVLPGSELTPTHYRDFLQQLAKQMGWQHTCIDEIQLAELGAGAFLAVSQGSPRRDSAIVKLSYRPATAHKRVALVGKGLCFDTGGYNLKSGGFMYGMHQDMAGSAVALGTLLALSRIQAPLAVDCYLAIAENHIGPEAFKPNDLVTSLNGTTIEVVDTDAEGRMVLADALTLATRDTPDLVIDYATLTGACVRAIGTRYSGAFSNRSDWTGRLIALGQASGERIWPFPLDKDYDEHIDSKMADVLQCAPAGSTDHIDAARFLQRFVENDVPWLHLDLSAFKHKGGLGHVPTDVSGFGVSLSLELLLAEDGLLEHAPEPLYLSPG